MILRLVNITHGFPYIYHADEPAVIRAALGMRFDINPGHFDWPHLYIYLNYFMYMVFAKLRDITVVLGLKETISGTAPIIYNDNLIFYLLSRIFSAILGALTVIPLYLWAKKLTDRSTALISSVLLTTTPLHVRNSHYALIDVPMIFFLSWSLYFSTFSPALSGLFLGFSASTKYHGVLGALYIALYYLMSKRKFKDFVITGAFSVLGFIIGTPFSVLDYKTFIRTDGPEGALWQFTNVGKVGLLQQINHFIYALSGMFPQNLGPGILIIFGLGTGILIYRMARKKPVNMPVALTALIFLVLTFYVSGAEKNREHYYMVTYPFFLMASAWSVRQILDKFPKFRFKIALLALIIFPSPVLSVWNINNLLNKTNKRIYGGDTITTSKDNTNVIN